jgi:sugar phosphate permease
MLILLMKWFTRQERSRANTLLILGNPVTVLWMSAATGFIIHAVGWKMTFVIEGVPSILWGVVWLLMIRDKPADAPWMSPEAASQLTSTIKREQALIHSIGGARSSLYNTKVFSLCLVFFLWSVGVYGFILWLPQVIQQGAARGIAITGLLNAVPYLFAVILMILVSHYSDRSSGARARFVWPFLVLAGLALFGSFLTTNSHFWWSYAFVVAAGGLMYAPYGPFFAIIPEILAMEIAGDATALINSLGALGAFAGSWAVGFLNAITGNAQAGFLVMSVCVALSGVLLLFTRTSNPELAASMTSIATHNIAADFE